MEPISAFTSFFSTLQQANTLFKHISHTQKGIKTLKTWVKEYQQENTFYDIFEKGQWEWIDSSPPFSLQQEDYNVAVILAGMAFWRYRNDSYFNRILLHNDPYGEMGHLPMNQYFIQLSYLSHFQLRDRDTLIQKEKEIRSRGIDTRSRFTRSLSEDYISAAILHQNHQIIISGNPGIGKSTYAKWLCNHFAETRMPLPALPLYIRLGHLSPNTSNGITDYLLQYYLQGDSQYLPALRRLFNAAPDSFLLILDGYDEMDQVQQRKLYKNLIDLGVKPRYLLLSRPYALVNHPFHPDAAFQIDGFNDSTIHEYINLFVKEEANNQKGPKQLLDIIRANPVLFDYATNPLMLSQMVWLYLQRPDAPISLERVTSSYQLQFMVYNWVISYHAQKPNPIKLAEQEIKRMQDLALTMELERKVDTSVNLDGLGAEGVARELATLGLGSLRVIGLDKRFHFYSLTFQEFLAAQSIGSTLNEKAFLYLSREKFFWNFIKMIAGYLCTHSQFGQLKIYLFTLREEIQAENRSYVQCLYFMMLAESPNTFFQSYLDTKGIRELIDLYLSVFFDSYWSSIVMELISLLYKKGSIPFQKRVMEEVITRLPYFPPEGSLENISQEEYFYLFFVIKELALTSEPSIVKAMGNSLNQLLQGLKSLYENYGAEDLEEEHIDLEVWYLNTSNMVAETLATAPQELISEYISQPLPYHPQILRRLLRQLGPILAMIDPDYSSIEVLSERIPKGINENLDAGEVRSLAIGAYGICKVYSMFEKEEKAKASLLVNRVGEVLLKKLAHMHAKGEVEEALELGTEPAHILVAGMTLLSSEVLFSTIYSLLGKFSLWRTIEIEDHEAFKAFLISLIEQQNEKEEDFHLSSIDMLMEAMVHTFNAHYLYGMLREELFELFVDWMAVHDEVLGQYSLQMELEDMATLALVERSTRFAEMPHFSFDKKYFADRLISSSYATHPFVYRKLVLKLLEHEFPFYEEKYWNPLFQLMEEPEYIPEVVGVLTNESIYLYSANLPFLGRMMQKLATWISKLEDPADTLGNLRYSLLHAISGTLTLLSQTKDNLHIWLLKHTGEILKNPIVRQFVLEEDDPEMFDFGEMLAYLYQYLFTRDESVCLGVDWGIMLGANDSIKRMIAEHSMQHFLTHEGAPPSIGVLQIAVGEKMAEYIHTYTHDFSLHEFKFDSTHFQKLISV